MFKAIGDYRVRPCLNNNKTMNAKKANGAQGLQPEACLPKPRSLPENSHRSVKGTVGEAAIGSVCQCHTVCHLQASLGASTLCLWLEEGVIWKAFRSRITKRSQKRKGCGR